MARPRASSSTCFDLIRKGSRDCGSSGPAVVPTTNTYRNHGFIFGDPSHIMSGCTLRFTKSSPVRTTLFDEATGHAKYKIETPIKVSHVVTRIRKLESHTQPPPHLDEEPGSDSDDDATLCGGTEGKLPPDRVEEHEINLDFPESSDEMARIYWKLLAPDKFIFQGKEHIRSEFLPKCGKMNG